jgi:anti-sigma B factor antagonist
MDVTREQPDGETVLLAVAGNIDIYTSPELRGELKVALDNRVPRIVVDLEHVTFVDSSGLATLIEALQKVNEYSGKLTLCSLAKTVLGVFKLSNLDSLFDIRPDRESSLGD